MCIRDRAWRHRWKCDSHFASPEHRPERCRHFQRCAGRQPGESRDSRPPGSRPVSAPRTLPRLFICYLLASLPGLAASAEPLHAPVRMEAPVQDKNFYLLSMLERTPEVRDAVRAEPALARIAAERMAALDQAAKTCNLDLDCYAAAFQLSLIHI